VAGALTFFPPDPPLYGFQRLNKDGESLPEEADEGEEEKTSEEDDVGDLEFDDEDEDETDEKYGENGQAPDDRSLSDMPQSKAKKVDKTKKKKKASPSQQLTERARILRQRAKSRNRRDAKDAEAGVTFNFAPDPRLACPSLSARMTAEAVKVGPQKKTGTYIAALIYRYQPRNPPSSNKDRPVKTILYSHGNATDIGAMNMMQSVMCRAIGCNVVMYDYSGYGESGGIPLESNTYRDIKLMYKYVVDHVANGVEANVVVYGQSVGSGPSCYICSKEPDVGGLILHSPFTSGMRVLTPSR
jgi:acetyl esterase/lipase